MVLRLWARLVDGGGSTVSTPGRVVPPMQEGCGVVLRNRAGEYLLGVVRVLNVEHVDVAPVLAWGELDTDSTVRVPLVDALRALVDVVYPEDMPGRDVWDMNVAIVRLLALVAAYDEEARQQEAQSAAD